jgi:hypothetical protein
MRTVFYIINIFINKTTLLLLTALLLFSCSENSSNSPHHPMQEIKGRDYSGKRFHVYPAKDKWALTRMFIKKLNFEKVS